MNPNTVPPEDTGAMTDAEMRMAQAEQHNSTTEALLETLIQQGEKNNPEPILEHMVVQNEDLKNEVKKIQEPLSTVTQFMEQFTRAVEQIKGDKGDKGEDAVVDYEKVVSEAVPKVQESLNPAIEMMPEVIAKRLAEDKQFIKDVQPDVDPAEVAHILRKNPDFIQQTKGDNGDVGTFDYAKIVYELKNDEEFMTQSKGEPGTSIVVKSKAKTPVIDSETLLKLLAGKISYNDLKDKPQFFKPKSYGGAGYLREISDVSLTDLQIDDFIKWNGTRWVNAAVTGGGGTWGSITGTISNQTDLQDALDLKADVTALSAYFNKSTDDTDDITVGATNKFATAAEKTKVGFITVTQAVDLDQMEIDIAALANGMVYKGNWAANTGTFPGAGVAEIGWFYTVSVAGTVDSIIFNVGDRIIAIVDNASTTTYAGNWTQLDATDAVTSIFGRVGNIVAVAGDYNAGQVTFTPTGGIASTDVQAAIAELDTEKQPLDADLTAIAGLSPSNDDILQRKSGAWTNRTLVQLQADMDVRIGTEASSATSTPTIDTVDQWNVTALATADVFAAPTGTPTNGQKLIIRIKDNGTARALSWNAIYRASTDLPLPTTTVLSKTMYLGFIYNLADTKWDLVAYIDNI